MTHCMFKVIRKSLSKYIEIKVKKFMKIGGAVAIDETLIGRQRWGYLGGFPQVKWAWGIIDL